MSPLDELDPPARVAEDELEPAAVVAEVEADDGVAVLEHAAGRPRRRGSRGRR